MKKRFIKFSNGCWGCFDGEDIGGMIFFSLKTGQWVEYLEKDEDVPGIELFDSSLLFKSHVPKEILAKLPKTKTIRSKK